MTPSRLVTAELFRTYRPIALFLLVTMMVIVSGGMTAAALLTEIRFSLWVTIAGSATKFWLGVVGVLLVVIHLRPFLGAGLTRRAVLTGSARFGVLTAAGFAVLVPLGHGIEYLLLRLGGAVTPEYPAFTAAVALRDFGFALPSALGFLVTGVAAGTAFYRFTPWRALLLLVPAALPAVAAEVFFGLDERGGFGTRLLPYLPAVVVLLAVTALGAWLCRRLLRDVAVRRSAA